MILHLEKDIQDMISSLLISMERDHMTLLAQAQSELQRINELADMIDRTGDVLRIWLLLINYPL